ncbi:MAG: arsenate reductase (glutaredoxin) [Chromatiales bacterium]|jgi:arsenate reductase|nr:arsenate reductase (glutaredoxin) [Chromatiales bacterium]
MKVTIYHNPRCSKSRAALELLRERGIEPQIIEYLHAPPDAATIKQLLRKLGMKPRELLRKSELAFRELDLADASKSDADLINAMASHPALIERPIVIVDDKAVVGRPPELILELLA